MFKRNTIMVLALAVAVLAGCSGSVGKPQVGKAAPDFELKELSGAVHELSEYKGKVVLVVFWATWCPPCRQEIPSLIRLQKRYAANGFEVLSISLDSRPEKELPRFIARNNINYRVLIGTPQVEKDYGGISSIPQGFLVDREGKLSKHYRGYTLESRLVRDIEAIL